ncbi:hypothetical protein AAFF_G00407350 [Aldrovandia affinis]|uniref:Uncharacterized protein n=1 Tax=Aldrovandia affinis TaxID=143900 RepID=A0AAD7R3T5_9TELE|nr:hypothetical protein AAFF_G00407350 [Aldrovandia affinis]
MQLQEPFQNVEETIVKDLRLASHNTAKDVFRVLENRFGNKNAITILIVAELQKISPVKEHQFRKVIDLIRITEKALADLKDLDNEAAIKNPLVTGAIENKLPLTLKKEWLTFKEDPKNSVQPESYFDALLDFLQKQERILEQLEQMEITEFPEKKTEKKFASTRATERGSTEDNCVLCENKHRSRLFTCKKFRGLDLAARKAAVKKSRACRLCLSSHGADGECNLKFLCTKKGCKKGEASDHHYLLCPSRDSKKDGGEKRETQSSSCERVVGDLVLWEGPLGKIVSGTHPNLFEDVETVTYESKTHFARSMRTAAAKYEEIVKCIGCCKETRRVV